MKRWINKMAIQKDNGIGTLLLFVALILLASVSAGVLITTAQKLQQQSLDFPNKQINTTINCKEYLDTIFSKKEITFFWNGKDFIDARGFTQYDYYIQCERSLNTTKLVTSYTNRYED